MKSILILVSCLLIVNASMFAQTVKQDSMTDEQKIMVLKMLGVMMAGEGRDQAATDSIRNAIEAKYKLGTLAPDFRFKNVKGKEVSLKQLRGKYVYIDVWATWCGPCCKELPFLQKLEEKMKGKNITFVSISYDRKKEDWVNMVKKDKLGGIQLHFGGDEKFFQEFRIDAIPRFILVDKEGKVVKAFMSRPSNPETEQFLMALKGI